jgi:hypothetical protein
MINFTNTIRPSIIRSIRPFSSSRTVGKLTELNQYHFPPSAKIVGKVWGLYKTAQIRQEPALFSVDIPFAFKHGGPITRKILDELIQIPSVRNAFNGDLPGHHIIIDTRIHELQIGEYPAIPGWHTDFVERTASTNMQPDYRSITDSVKIYVVNISDHEKGVSNTEYLQDSIKLNIPLENIYMKIDEQIRERLSLRKAKVSDGDILQMDQHSLHRVTPTHSPGMRYFFRLSILHNLAKTILQKSPVNELRKHSHIYLSMDQALPLLPSELFYSALIPKLIQKLVFHKEKALRDRLSQTGQCSKYGPVCDNSIAKAFSKWKIQFLSQLRYKIIGNLPSVYSVKAIKQEPILVDAGFHFSFDHGGPITRKFLLHLESHPLIQKIIAQGKTNDITVNTRVHMLMEGQYPDISSWRYSAPFEEAIAPMHRHAEHFVMYACNRPDGVSFIEIRAKGESHIIKDGDIMHFTDGVINRSLHAHNSGWRFSIVVTINSKKPHQNTIATQLPVYLENINLGW